MTRTELNRFQVILCAKATHLERLIRQREGIKVERAADQLEETQHASERAIAVSKLDREFNQLRNVRAALLRIYEGGFGTCQACDQDIHPKRLAAVPWAPLCVECQEDADRNREYELSGDILASAA